MMIWLLAAFKALAAVFGFGEKVVAEVHDNNERVTGKNEIIAADNAASAKAEHDAASAMVNTTDDSVSQQLRDGSA